MIEHKAIVLLHTNTRRESKQSYTHSTKRPCGIHKQHYTYIAFHIYTAE